MQENVLRNEKSLFQDKYKSVMSSISVKVKGEFWGMEEVRGKWGEKRRRGRGRGRGEMRGTLCYFMSSWKTCFIFSPLNYHEQWHHEHWLTNICFQPLALNIPGLVSKGGLGWWYSNLCFIVVRPSILSSTVAAPFDIHRQGFSCPSALTALDLLQILWYYPSKRG